LKAVQKTLSAEQIKDFYHQNFVSDQVADFAAQVPLPLPDDEVVLDVGGGFGFFAEALARTTGVRVRVLDSDPLSVQACRERGVDAELSDALNPRIRGDEAVVSFNLILHHLIGSTGSETTELQRRALLPWRDRARYVIVNEYIYESWGWPGTSAWLIWSITRNRLLSRIGAAVSKVVPSLRANTFGVGVRFRDADDWKRMFESLGFEVKGHIRGEDEKLTPALRMLMIRYCRRDSFLLVSKQ
jgi:SAM-dependent methyltransferase